ncbi:hypothetical protein TSOC_002534 [Tetrabaena socialis]|uniref:GCK domain-containing protein n=1 Tax=Tetrabaena socialis TaxID=47790 RepID=A0A2J8AE01_9CHLO|nr:hypothetical protein TSOC_002534 [Tetrabaena socialis]|eukprot:PNH10740.1 hypothetical protein TSOC_002534 [Tetrabaena socialis]
MQQEEEPAASAPTNEKEEDNAAEGSGRSKECPICVMMREGGCEKPFNSFMDCGVQAEKGEGNYQDCVALFESMRLCMQKSPAVFGEVLRDVEDLAKSNTEYPPTPEQPAAPAS